MSDARQVPFKSLTPFRLYYFTHQFKIIHSLAVMSSTFQLQKYNFLYSATTPPVI